MKVNLNLIYIIATIRMCRVSVWGASHSELFPLLIKKNSYMKNNGSNKEIKEQETFLACSAMSFRE